MENLKIQITQILIAARDEVQSNMQSQGVNATGATSDSIRVEDYDGGVRLVGGVDADKVVSGAPRGEDVTTWLTAPMPTLETGRPAGAVPKGFYYIIKQWTRDKGITFAKESDRQTFAFFLSRKIAAQGTARSRNPIDIYTTPAQAAVSKIQQLIKSDVRNALARALSQLNV